MNKLIKILVCAVVSTTCLFTHTQDTSIFSVNQQRFPACFSRPLEFSRKSIISFLKDTFNHSNYPQHWMAVKFDHISQGLAIASQHTHPRRFAKKVLNLFFLKMHNIYVNPYAWHAFTEDLIAFCGSHTAIEAERRTFIQSCKNILATYLVNDFDRFQIRTDQVLEDFAADLHDYIASADDRDISIREFQHCVHYFLTKGLSLLIWNPDEQEDAWHIMLALASTLEECASRNLIDTDMLDDLNWTLLHKFSSFLEIAATELAPSFFDAARTSLQTENRALFDADEREVYITTKGDYLANILIKAETISRLHATGHYTGNFVPAY